MIEALFPIATVVLFTLGWHAVDRRRPGLPFRSVFYGGVATCLVWLGVGLVPAIIHASPRFHDAMHRWAGTEGITTEVRAVNNTFDRDELVLPVARDVVLTFRNLDRGVLHNLVIFARGDDEDRPLVNAAFSGPGTREFAFRTPDGARAYLFRCDVHPGTMIGRVALTTGAGEQAHSPLRVLAGRAASVSHGAERGWQTGVDYLFSIVNLALAILLVRLRGDDVVARLFALAAISTAAATNLQSHATLTVLGEPLNTLHDVLLHPLGGLTYVFAVVMFPDGRLIPHLRARRMRVLTAAVTGGGVMVLLGVTGVFLPDPGVGHAVGYLRFFGLAVPLVGILAQGWKVRLPVRSPEQRQQSKLLMWALVPALLAGTAFLVAGAREAGVYAFGSEPSRIIFRVVEPVFVVVPIALFIGILRFRLWELDLVVSKTLVFGSLAGFIGAVYVAVVVGAGHVIGTRGEPNTALSIVATAIVAVAFQPVRERFERLANRVVYGDRATPYEVMADFSGRISGALSMEEVLPGMADAAAHGVRATRARVRLFLPDGRERVVSWPEEGGGGGFDHTITVTHQGEPVGEIAVAKAPGDPVRSADERLLAALASQAGLAMYNVRLTEELRARLEEISDQTRQLSESRQRLVTATIFEQRRLEREINDRIERQLVEMAEELARAERATEDGDRSEASLRLEAVSAKAGGALETLRDLARGIFPRLLADRGLVPALEALVRKSEEPVRLDGGAALARRFDPQAEAAVYFIVREALRNAARHAAGSDISVALALDEDWIEFRVADTGPGFDTSAISPDSDLHQMVDRVAAVGGTLEFDSARGRGTTVIGRVPASAAVVAR